MTPVRFSMAVLAAIVLFAATAPAQKAGILPREYQARRDALSKSIGPDALFIALGASPRDVRETSTGRSARRRQPPLSHRLNEPDTTLVLLPGERERRESLALMRPGVRKDGILGSEIFKQPPAADQASMRAAVTRYEGIGVRIEDDVLITAGEPKVLSAGAPRTVKNIEMWMAPKHQS